MTFGTFTMVGGFLLGRSVGWEQATKFYKPKISALKRKLQGRKAPYE